ncbi:rhamnan synthesis F family protein [Lysobacter soli]|uniref:rhamnan synthesis F family protein n=1 Tax=Lysobacter soli TaxID=453783 RepID=UPI00369425E0
MTDPHASTRIIGRLRDAIRSAIAVVNRHGGGLHGLGIVIIKSLHLLRALGLKGMLNRARLAGLSAKPSAPPQPVDFAPPIDVERVELTVGVMAHMFYPDLAQEFADALRAMPRPFHLLVSVVDDDAKEAVALVFGEIPLLASLQIKVVPNQGRDIAPMLVAFREEILALDVVAHIHTKKSLYTGSEQSAWRRYLVSSLFGSTERISWILGTFASNPRLGIIYPESHRAVPLWAHTWLGNLAQCRDLGRLMGLSIEPAAYIDFPAGSMFWARVDALRPLYDLKLEIEGFPTESGQTDGTLQHAIERLVVISARNRGLMAGVLPADGCLTLSSEGGRNWEQYFTAKVEERIRASAALAKIVSVDVFDTLVVRPFLTPDGSRAFLAHRVEHEFGLRDFAQYRVQAEALCRMDAGCDPDLDAIYRCFATLPGCRDVAADRIRDFELDHEAQQMLPRQAVVEAVARLVREGKRVVAVSDMYLNTTQLARVLPAKVRDLPARWFVSCETGLRKDTGEAWQRLPELESTTPGNWMHLGDNELADVQRPHDRGFRTTHVLRPSALLDVVPSLRMLRPAHGSSTAWQDQLWLGLVANRFAAIADRMPEAFSTNVRIEEPHSLGYLVIGPLLMDYLTWTSRLALERGMSRILFLSREGYLLERAFRVLKATSPALSKVDGTYLLASRRGVGTPALRSPADLNALLGGSFNGTLAELLSSRLGRNVAGAVASQLGPDRLAMRVFLPEMRAVVPELLAPAFDEVLKIAAREREAYQAYWASAAGPGLVADLGYAGSIQAHLARLTGATLGGAYFATNDRIDQVQVHGGWALARYQDTNVAGAIVANDLFLESLFTSPNGQFSHFELNDGVARPVFLGPEQDARALSLVSHIQDGALSFVRDACHAAGDHALDLAFATDLVQEPLRAFASGRWVAGEWISALSVGDTFSGRGVVSAKVGPR